MMFHYMVLFLLFTLQYYPTHGYNRECSLICNENDHMNYEPQRCDQLCSDWAHQPKSDGATGHSSSEVYQRWTWILLATNIATLLILAAVVLTCTKCSKVTKSLKNKLFKKEPSTSPSNSENGLSVIHVNLRTKNSKVNHRPASNINNNINKSSSPEDGVVIKNQRSTSLTPDLPKTRQRQASESRAPCDTDGAYVNSGLSLSASTLAADTSGDEMNSRLFTALSTATLETTISHGPGNISYSPGNASHSPGSSSHRPGNISYSPDSSSHSPGNNNSSISSSNSTPSAGSPPRCVSTQL